MMVSKRQAKPEPLDARNRPHFDKFFQKNLLFEERENNLKNNLNISIKQSLPSHPSEIKNEINASLSPSRLESCLERENSFAKQNETKSDALDQNLSLLIPISGEFPNKQSTPVSKSTSKTEPKLDDFDEEKLNASLIQIVDSSKNKNTKILDGNDYVSSDTDYETSKNNNNNKNENSTRPLSKSSDRSNSKSSTRSSGGGGAYSNLSSVSSDSDSSFDKSSPKSNAKTHPHRSRLIDSNIKSNNPNKNRNLSGESSSSSNSSSSSASSSQSLRSGEHFKSVSLTSGYNQNEASCFRNESKASRESTISSTTSKNNSSDEDSSSGRKTARKRYARDVDEKKKKKSDITSGHVSSFEESSAKRKSSYYNNEDEQDHLRASSSLHRRLGKPYDSNKYESKYEKFSGYHHRDRFQACKRESRSDSYHTNRSNNEREFSSSASLKAYNSAESSKNRVRTRSSSSSSSRESGLVAQQGFSKSSNEKINSNSPKPRRKQSLSPSSAAKSSQSSELDNSSRHRVNDYECGDDRAQKENSFSCDRSKYDHKYGEDRHRKSLESERAGDKEKDSCDYKSKNGSMWGSYKSNSYERFGGGGGGGDDFKSESKSFSSNYKKYSQSSSYVKSKYYHNAKKLPKFDLRYHLNKKNFNSSKSGNCVKKEESISTVRKRNVSNSRIDSSSKRQKE
jgi:hypothetical protein